jgi:hypothetical protein
MGQFRFEKIIKSALGTFLSHSLYRKQRFDWNHFQLVNFLLMLKRRVETLIPDPQHQIPLVQVF